MKAKHPKLIKALNFLEMEQESERQMEELLREVWVCKNCRDIDDHLDRCVKPIFPSIR